MNSPEKRDLTALARRVREGDPAAADELFPIVYQELHRMATNALGRRRVDHTLQASALVNEAYLRLFGGEGARIADREHFWRMAASSMRSILVDHARAKHRRKRTPDGERVFLDDLVDDLEERATNLVDLNEALERLGAFDPVLLRLVELRFFSGLTMDDAAEVLGLSPRTAAREWQLAKSWLTKELL